MQCLSFIEVITVKGDVNSSVLDLYTWQQLLQGIINSVSQVNTSWLQSDQCSLGEVSVIFDELVTESVMATCVPLSMVFKVCSFRE